MHTSETSNPHAYIGPYDLTIDGNDAVVSLQENGSVAYTTTNDHDVNMSSTYQNVVRPSTPNPDHESCNITSLEPPSLGETNVNDKKPVKKQMSVTYAKPQKSLHDQPLDKNGSSDEVIYTEPEDPNYNIAGEIAQDSPITNNKSNEHDNDNLSDMYAEPHNQDASNAESGNQDGVLYHVLNGPGEDIAQSAPATFHAVKDSTKDEEEGWEENELYISTEDTDVYARDTEGWEDNIVYSSFND